jgi:hypothetical protein
LGTRLTGVSSSSEDSANCRFFLLRDLIGVSTSSDSSSLLLLLLLLSGMALSVTNPEQKPQMNFSLNVPAHLL